MGKPESKGGIGMRKIGLIAAALAAGIALWAPPVLAQHELPPPAAAAPPAPARTPTPLEAAMDAADRGELGPLQRMAAGARGDLAAVIRGRLALARLDPAPADAALARIAAGRDPALRAAALSVFTADAFLRGAYAEAARWGRALEAADTARGDAEALQNSTRERQIAALLAGHPPQSLEGAVAARTIPERTDRVGLPRIDIAVNGQAQEAVFDTGASLSVLSAETARRLGVTVIEGATSVGNGVAGSVAVRLGVADRLEIAGTTLRNVPFLIIDDAQLTFPVPGGYDIKAIIGLPVMRALGRMRVEPAAGRLTVEPVQEAAAGPSNLVGGAGQIFLTVAIDGDEVPLHLDTGANRSGLSARYAAAYPARLAALATGQARMASAGGQASSRIASWRNAPLALAGRSLVLPMLTVDLAEPGAPPPRDYGKLGSEALRGFESYTLDFRAMRLELGPPVPAPAAAAPSPR